MSCPVTQWQILAKDPEGASAFYSGLFGWRINSDNPLGYRMIDTGSAEGIQGGIWPSPPEGHNFVQLFIQVESVADYVSREAGRARDHSSADSAGRRRAGDHARSPRDSFRPGIPVEKILRSRNDPETQKRP